MGVCASRPDFSKQTISQQVGGADLCEPLKPAGGHGTDCGCGGRPLTSRNVDFSMAQ